MFANVFLFIFILSNLFPFYVSRLRLVLRFLFLLPSVICEFICDFRWEKFFMYEIVNYYKWQSEYELRCIQCVDDGDDDYGQWCLMRCAKHSLAYLITTWTVHTAHCTYSKNACVIFSTNSSLVAIFRISLSPFTFECVCVCNILFSLSRSSWWNWCCCCCCTECGASDSANILPTCCFWHM